MKRIHKWMPYFLLVPLCILIVINGLYAFPIGDDLTYALKGKIYDLWTVTKMEYTTWNGRYTSNIFVVLNPMRWDSLFTYRLVPVFLLLVYAISVFQLVRRVLRLDSISWILFVLVFCLVYLQGMPIVSEGFYWYTGSVTYLLGLSFFNLYVSFALSDRIGTKKTVLLASFFLFLSSGSNEILMLWALIFSAILLCFRRRKSDLLLFGMAVLFGCLVYFAPGNMVRTSLFKSTHDLYYSSYMTFLQMGRFSLTWLVSIPNLIFILVVLLFKDKISLRFPVEWNRRKTIGLVCLLFFCFLAISIFPAYWSTGSMGQHRTVNLSYQLFIFAEIICILLLSIQINVFKIFKIICLSVFMFSFYLIGNTGDIVKDLIEGRSKQFAKEMSFRWQCCKQDSVITCYPAINSKPKSLLNYEMTTDTLDWKNTCYKDYFEMNYVPKMCKDSSEN